MFRRIKWKNDKPATEKQLAYAYSLLHKLQSGLRAFAASQGEERVAWQFWTAADIPPDLTFIEATKLIDDLLSASSFKLPAGIVEAILKRVEGGPLSTNNRAIVFTSIFPTAAEFVCDIVRERMAARWQQAEAIHQMHEASR